MRNDLMRIFSRTTDGCFPHRVIGGCFSEPHCGVVASLPPVAVGPRRRSKQSDLSSVYVLEGSD